MDSRRGTIKSGTSRETRRQLAIVKQCTHKQELFGNTSYCGIPTTRKEGRRRQRERVCFHCNLEFFGSVALMFNVTTAWSKQLPGIQQEVVTVVYLSQAATLTTFYCLVGLRSGLTVPQMAAGSVSGVVRALGCPALFFFLLLRLFVRFVEVVASLAGRAGVGKNKEVSTSKNGWIFNKVLWKEGRGPTNILGIQNQV